MGKQWVLALAISGLAACTGGSLANKSHPTPTGGTVTPTGGNVVAPDSGVAMPDTGAVETDAAATDALATDATATPDTKVDPLKAAPTCTSKTTWTTGESDKMAPGQACIGCHVASGEGPKYTIAGTLYPTGHEPDDCNGASGAATGAKIVVTGANGTTLTLTPNSVGNFFSIAPVALPYTVKVVTGQGLERLMVTSTSNGDCNDCHSQNGSDGAPGRVTLP